MKGRLRALAVLLAVFLAGIIIGAAGFFFWPDAPEEAMRPFNGSHPPSRERMARPLFPQLDLTEEQKERFGHIMAETRKKFEEMETLRRRQMVDLDQKRNAILEEHNSRVASILNEDQKMKFDNFVKQWNEWLEKGSRRERPEPPKENPRKPARM
ncbi:MAG: hypothetical protein JW793_13060 [Acidobacteria bacterium]|nr:hypothetical protein [Acidobacteriota bacterium]